MLKYTLGRFFWAPIPHKQYQNTSGFASDCIGQHGVIWLYCQLLNPRNRQKIAPPAEIAIGYSNILLLEKAIVSGYKKTLCKGFVYLEIKSSFFNA